MGKYPIQEGFIPHDPDRDNEPKVTIKEDGVITLSSAIVEKSNIYPSVPPPNVVAYYNKRKDKIALEPKEKKVKDGLKLRRVNPDAKTFVVSARRFLKKYDIGHPVNYKYPAKWRPDMKERGCIVVDLDPLDLAE
ncbi:hypothetical protein K9M78_00770 [Candidatus Bipolaricaulota bacterium]|nr:hypothetical protein [Candidatus Bipolaricaulota bacterium]